MPNRDEGLAKAIAKELSRMLAEKVGNIILGKALYIILMLLLIAGLFVGVIHIPAGMADKVEAVRAQ